MLEFIDLKKSFGEREVLKGISLGVKEGEILFVLGTSGTGKSVLLKLLVGLLKSTSGEIWIDGENVTNYTEEQFLPVRKKCGMVFQHPALFDSISVFENVVLRKEYKEALNPQRHLLLTQNRHHVFGYSFRT